MPSVPKLSVLDDLVEAVAAVSQRAGQVLAKQRVGQEDAADERQAPAHDAPRRLEHQHDQDHADHPVGLGQVAGALRQVGLEHPLVQAGEKAGDAQHPARARASSPLLPSMGG